MNKGVKRLKTGYKGLADISNKQRFELHLRFGSIARIHQLWWVVRELPTAERVFPRLLDCRFIEREVSATSRNTQDAED